MLEIEDQLGRYGDALERELLNRSDLAVKAPVVRRARSRRAVVAAGALLLVIATGIGAIVAGSLKTEDSLVATGPAASTEQTRAGVFSTATNTVLLFSDGIDGATAIDLDGRLAGRRVIEGERAGDQPFRLTLTGDHLVVGWGEIYAAPLSGEPSSRIADATIYVPASEPGEVWALTWAGGRIGEGAVVLERVRVDGTVVFTSTEFDAVGLQAVIGVPGGLAVNTPEGVAVWDADTGTTGPALGPGPATGATSDGRSLAWCESTCSTFHTIELERTGSPTAPHVSSGQQIAFSGDGARLAVLRRTGTTETADLLIVEVSTSEQAIVARELDWAGGLQWTGDGRQLFYTDHSSRESSMRVGRYEVGTQRWEIQTLPIRDGFVPIALDRGQTRSFFTDELVPVDDCRGGGRVFPSGRQGVCTFAFFTPDSPQDCVADGPRLVEVPDAIGLGWTDAAILMQLAGLNVVGSDTTSADRGDQDAAVVAQEPPAGSRVPEGACVGLRSPSG